jgi:hypothetical protein
LNLEEAMKKSTILVGSNEDEPEKIYWPGDFGTGVKHNHSYIDFFDENGNRLAAFSFRGSVYINIT